MCGATAAQNNLQAEEAAFYQENTQEASQAYAEDQQILGQITAITEPILAKGPNQTGFSTAETQNLNAEAVEGTAENYGAAAKAVNEEIAAGGGGDTGLSTGGTDELREEVANSAAATESGEESQIKQADYAQGYSEYENAENALETASGQLNPAAYSAAATSAGNAEENTASAIANENDSWINAAIGAAGAIGAGWAKGGFAIPGGGGSGGGGGSDGGEDAGGF